MAVGKCLAAASRAVRWKYRLLTHGEGFELDSGS